MSKSHTLKPNLLVLPKALLLFSALVTFFILGITFIPSWVTVALVFGGGLFVLDMRKQYKKGSLGVYEAKIYVLWGIWSGIFMFLLNMHGSDWLYNHEYGSFIYYFTTVIIQGLIFYAGLEAILWCVTRAIGVAMGRKEVSFYQMLGRHVYHYCFLALAIYFFWLYFK